VAALACGGRFLQQQQRVVLRRVGVFRRGRPPAQELRIRRVPRGLGSAARQAAEIAAAAQVLGSQREKPPRFLKSALPAR
jgi:hypothetical protein